MVTVQKRLERPILHVLGNVVLAQVGINADPVRSSAREEKSSRGVEHGIHKDACVVGPTSPRRRVASQTSQHGEKRSEEHTSELQSRLHLVCRLLLEKKKKTHTNLLHDV